ncbi:response regulator [Sneathiella litorea]|uniref:Response regulator n=1 Tax=Sneathiella litorea TaxID=2606216 RepID=A0A6L8WBG5_9PROT|nr:response regulator [Sneathiella litorea]MZR32415.1 response regulator [Sneathiella litorea]
MTNYYNFRNLNVIFVDDNRNMHLLMRSILLAMNIVNSRGCYDAKSCIEKMHEEAPDIVISDLSPNPENGLDLIRRIRQGELGVDPYTPILVISGQTKLQNVIEARDAGATEFLAKPVSVGSLYDRLVWMIENPRVFIKASEFIGPDRRRAMRGYEGMERRK